MSEKGLHQIKNWNCSLSNVGNKKVLSQNL